LYLLHFYVLHEWGLTLVGADWTYLDRVAIYVALMGVALVVARLCYVCFERPAMLILRSAMDPRRARPPIPATAVTS
jgi:peptidoglycan/LPS O-acetylase OafA/YrhL